MGRHAEGKHSGSKRRVRPLPILFGVAGLAVVIALGVWWWGLRDSTDPIDADPQRAYAVVVASQPCTDPNAGTTVEFQVAGQTVSASLGGCGFKVDQRLAIQYLNSDPDQIRLVGVTATPASSTLKRLLPIAILAIGFVAVIAALALIREKRQGRRRMSAATAGSALTVSQMREAVQAARPAPTSPPQTASVTVIGVPPTEQSPPDQPVGRDEQPAGPPAPAAEEHHDLFAPKADKG